MKRFEISGKTGKSTILVGAKLAEAAGCIGPAGKVAIITDDNVARLYGRRFPAGDIFRIGTGEAVKNLATVQTAYERLAAIEADRSVFIVGIGGGVVCDIAGFVASTWLRGVRFGFVATTLLAQVDASVGGKNGVNFGGYKNLIGIFRQPEFVLCDPALLATLPEKERLNGLAEIIKHALIGDPAAFALLEREHRKVLQLDPATIEQLVYASVLLKAAVVNRDETEQGERRKLNFGHTFGHAIEKTTGMAHGEAVALGMVAACRISQQKGLLSEGDAERAIALIRRFNLPVRLPLNGQQLLDALRRDKKRVGDRIHFVLLEEIGRAVVKAISLDELQAATGSLFQ